MWVPKEVADWFRISKDSVDDLREDLSAVRAERAALKVQLAVTQNNFEWMRGQFNQLQLENKALLEVAHGIRVPAPSIMREPKIDPQWDPRNLTGFDDIGDDLASSLGLPRYDDKN